MKKMALAALGLLLTATSAHAEHKLLVTDVLEPKQVEAQALFEYMHSSENLSNPILGQGKAYFNSTESLYSLGVGLGHGLEMTAFLPYVFSEREKVQFGEEVEHGKRDGVGDFAIEAKYRLLGGEEAPFTVVTGLDVKFDTAGSGADDVGTGTTTFSPFVAASANLQHHHIPYAMYRASIPNHGAPDVHTVSVGLEKEINHTLTLDARIDANFVTASSRNTAYETFVFELTPYIQVAHNFYLLPTAAYLKSTDSRSKIGDTRVTSADGFRAGASLYYLF